MMIQEIGIKNYKSIQEIKIELGRVTVFRLFRTYQPTNIATGAWN